MQTSYFYDLVNDTTWLEYVQGTLGDIFSGCIANDAMESNCLMHY